MPVGELFDNPAYITLPVGGRGMLLSMCEYFWRGACKSFPRDDDQLFAIARAHRPTWRHHKATILDVFNAWRPHAEAYWHLRDTKGTTIKFRQRNGGQATAAIRQAHAAEISTRPQPIVLPRKEPPPARPRPLPRDQRPERARMVG